MLKTIEFYLNREEISKVLKNSFKLSLYEAKTYLSLLEGNDNVKTVSRDSGVPLPRIYDTLRSLEDKGFVKKKNKKYTPVEPESALEGRIINTSYEFQNIVKTQKESKKDILSVLKKKPVSENADVEFETLIGVNNIGNKFLEIMKDSKKITISVKKAFEVKELFLSFLVNSKGKSKQITILTPNSYNISKFDEEILKKSNVELKKRSYILLDLMATDQGDVIIGVPDASGTPEGTIAIWIKNKEFAKSLMTSLMEE